MVRTQIQLPDALYIKARQLAKTKEVSLAELTRRGLEYILSVHPDPTPAHIAWHPPKPRPLGCRPLSAAALRDAARAMDSDDRLAPPLKPA